MDHKETPEYQKYLANKSDALAAIKSEIDWNMRFLNRICAIRISQKDINHFMKFSCKVVEISARVRMLLIQFRVIEAQPFVGQFKTGGKTAIIGECPAEMIILPKGKKIHGKS